MNREQVKELLPVIQAFAEGRTIQWRDNKAAPEWFDIISEAIFVGINFNQEDIEWRIKPEKKTGWINIYPKESNEYFGGTHSEFVLGNSGGVYTDKKMADHINAQNSPPHKRIACIKISYAEGEGL